MLLLSLPTTTSLLPSLPTTTLKPNTRSRPTMSAAASTPHSSSGSMLRMDFPYLSEPYRALMSDLLATLDSHLGQQLLPSSVPADVRSFQNDAGTSKGAIDIFHGAPGSKVDLVLQSWLHCALPTTTLHITTLFAFLNATTDAPHLLLELIQPTPTTLVLLLDHLPRTDLVLHPSYLHRYYTHPNLDRHRAALARLPSVRPYVSPALFVRSVLSPTAVAVEMEGEEGVEEVARGVVGSWVGECLGEGMGLVDVEMMRRRDGLVKEKAVEVDLTANLPRLFGEEVGGRLVEVIQKAFGLNN